MPDPWEKPCHIYAVKCPFCGKPNDFREVGDAICGKPNDFREVGDAIVEVGGNASPTVECDHCRGVIEVVKTQVTTLVWVRRWAGGPATKKQQFLVLRCSQCKYELYPTETGGFFHEGQAIGPGSRCWQAPGGKPCQGHLQRQVITDEVGDRHQVLKRGNVVLACPACKSEFYDRGPRRNEFGQELCNCGEPLIRR